MSDADLPAHVPVMCDEVVGFLRPGRGGVFVDCTVGLGGHARALLDHGASQLVGLDRDPAAIARAREVLAPWKTHVALVHADYRDLAEVLDARGLHETAGILADLGVSAMQLEAVGRGFSFRRDEPLDMRMDPTRGETAAERLARVDESELADVIFQFGEERHSRRIARALVNARGRAPLATTGQLADLVRRAIPRHGWQRIDPATRTFQALRIWVNQELEGLDGFLVTAVRRLAVAARIAVITFHSLEDRIVKHTLRALDRGDEHLVRVLTKHPVRASDDEVARNPRARSAKLRVAERE